MRDIVTQYRAVAQGAGFAENAARGRLRFEGADVIPFLQALVTADLSGLSPGQHRYSTYLTPNGRMLADLTVRHRGDHLLVDVPASRAPALAERFDSLVFTEDVRVADISAAIAQFLVVGPRASEAIARADLPSVSADAFAASDGDPIADGIDVFVASAARDRLAGALAGAGAIAMPPELVDVFRIEAGRPLFGADMSEDTIPLEAGLLDRAISTTKGCYVGQEIVIRMLHRGGGRVAKRLVKLSLPESIEAPPPAGTPLIAEGRPAGAITSAVFSPASHRVVALGYLARQAAVVGQVVGVEGRGDAEVVALAG